ncbi:MAG: hypothetical protein AAGM04_04855 [Pseudomonadota bacterium]
MDYLPYFSTIVPAIMMVCTLVMVFLRGRQAALRVVHTVHQFSQLKPRDMGIAVAFVALLVGGVVFQSGFANSSTRDAFRAQLLVPSEVMMLPDQMGIMRRMGRAEFRFSDPQWTDYLAKTKDRTAWKGLPFNFKGKTFEAEYRPGARRWATAPKPIQLVSRKKRKRLKRMSDLPWIYHLWYRNRPKDIRRARVMCTVFTRSRSSRSSSGSAEYRAEACAKVKRKVRIVGYVIGVLDMDNKTLTVRMG